MNNAGYVDRFGNAITNIESAGEDASTVRVPGKVQCDIRGYYQGAPRGEPLALTGSSGFLEIAVNGGNAAQIFALALGDAVEVR